jgi:Tfp pilus assembly protein PilF
MENVSINLAREVSIMALDPHPAPSGEARRATAERLKGALDQLARQAQEVAGGELDDAVDEAMNHIRSRRT